ncbi:carbohydrate ABC transporter permease [Nocardia stercoris]|uniref:Carbohydrate ABC transporter permease n=1 Tax=Nocardia stercoris TaxID=2483361 RepID=A0A3M2KZI5_9NOCA|nr:carbohydrate ABC transporter permease [Nocardia stercoris]
MIYAALVAVAWCALAPVLFAVAGSLQHTGATGANPVPGQPRWSNYRLVFEYLPFGRMLLNTVLYAGCVTVGQVFFCSTAGYAFARLPFRGRDLIFLGYLGTLMIPATATVLPQFILMRALGWVDTPLAMVVPGLFGSAFGTYLMRQFYLNLPVELEEAATLDGCSVWQTYRKVVAPNARPAMLVLAVLTWVTVWNDFLWPLVMIQRDSISTVTLGLVWMQGQYATQRPVLLAASVVMLAPMVGIYALAHRAFVRGVITTGLR